MEITATLDRIGQGDRRSLARAITEIENRSETGRALATALGDLSLAPRAVGVTGPPGAGKSSLINALVPQLQLNYPRIGILTVDPSSPVSGGAVLGDRVRMAGHSANPDVFIRSLAARGHLGGVTRTTRAVIELLAAGGMDLVIVETVGTGQSEVEIAQLTDVRLVVCAPGMGDEMQAIKAGVLEIADLLVVNKADLPDADRTASFLKSMLMHRGHDEQRALAKVSVTEGTGVGDLAEAIHARLGRDPQRGRFASSAKNDPLEALASAVSDLVTASGDPALADIAGALVAGSLTETQAARRALSLMARNEASSPPGNREN